MESIAAATTTTTTTTTTYTASTTAVGQFGPHSVQSVEPPLKSLSEGELEENSRKLLAVLEQPISVADDIVTCHLKGMLASHNELVNALKAQGIVIETIQKAKKKL